MSAVPKPVWFTRSSAGLFTPNTSRLSSRSDLVAGVTFHRSGERTTDPLGKWKQIQQLAMLGELPSGDKYGDHPYNVGFVIDGEHAGAILPGRENRWNGAHATSTHNIANRITLGACVIGDGTVTPAAANAIRAWLYTFALTYKRAPILLDHRDWHGAGGIATSCPGDDLEHFVAELRTHARAAA